MRTLLVFASAFLISCHTAREAYKFTPTSTYQEKVVIELYKPDASELCVSDAYVDRVSVAPSNPERKLLYEKPSIILPIAAAHRSVKPKSVFCITQNNYVKPDTSLHPRDYDVGEMLLALGGLALCILSVIPLGYLIAGLVAMDSAAAVTAGIVFLLMLGIGLVLYLVNK